MTFHVLFTRQVGKAVYDPLLRPLRIAALRSQVTVILYVLLGLRFNLTLLPVSVF